MGYVITSNYNSFSESLEKIRKSHPYAEEISKMDLNTEVSEFIQMVEGLDDYHLHRHVTSIRNSQLVLIFHALTYDISDSLKEQLITILKLRIKKRFFHYNWIMLQRHYSNKYLIESLHILMSYMEEKHSDEYEQTLVGRLKIIDEDIIKRSLNLLEAEQTNIKDFFRKYRIIKDSPFAKAFINDFFLQCNVDGYHRNAAVFIDLVEHLDSQIYLLINHYLDTLDVLEYIDSINNLLVERYNMPGDNMFWNNIEEKLCAKFLEWSKIKALEKHIGHNRTKFIFWNKYHQTISKITYNEELEMVFIYLDKFIVVDFKKDKNKSYLYKKTAFNKSLNIFKNQRGLEKDQWPLNPDEIMTAKDAVLNDMDSNIYSLSYERVGKLYIQDILEQA